MSKAFQAQGVPPLTHPLGQKGHLWGSSCSLPLPSTPSCPAHALSPGSRGGGGGGADSCSEGCPSCVGDKDYVPQKLSRSAGLEIEMRPFYRWVDGGPERLRG